MVMEKLGYLKYLRIFEIPQIYHTKVMEYLRYLKYIIFEYLKYLKFLRIPQIFETLTERRTIVCPLLYPLNSILPRDFPENKISELSNILTRI